MTLSPPPEAQFRASSEEATIHAIPGRRPSGSDSAGGQPPIVLSAHGDAGFGTEGGSFANWAARSLVPADLKSLRVGGIGQDRDRESFDEFLAALHHALVDDHDRRTIRDHHSKACQRQP